MKRYILTGGPGSGKSSILLLAESRGEHIVREAAEDHIRLRQAQGQTTPWIEPGFQLSILELQLLRERRVPQDAPRVLLDRGVADGLAYAQEGTSTYGRIEQAALEDRYDGVFLVEQLEATEKNGVRRENHEEAHQLQEKLTGIYQRLGYTVIRIPAGPVEERLDTIMRHIA